MVGGENIFRAITKMRSGHETVNGDGEYHHHRDINNDAILASWLDQQPVLVLGAFVTGLLGGVVYVHG
jgi:hypothetical protein